MLYWKRKLRGCGLRKNVFAASKENLGKGFTTILLIDFSKMTHLKVSCANDIIKRNCSTNTLTCRSYHVTISWHILRSDMTQQMSGRGWIFCPAHPSKQSVLFLTLFNLLLFTVKSETKEWRHIRSIRDEMEHLKTYFALWYWQG